MLTLSRFQLSTVYELARLIHALEESRDADLSKLNITIASGVFVHVPEAVVRKEIESRLSNAHAALAGYGIELRPDSAEEIAEQSRAFAEGRSAAYAVIGGVAKQIRHA